MSLTRAASAADPVALFALAAGGQGRAARLNEAAQRLANAGLPAVALLLARHAAAGAELDARVGMVARAFANADGEGPRVDAAAHDRIVEVLGDLGSARHVAILVPGMGTDLADGRTSVDRAARQLYDAASAMDPRVAVVTWVGYDPPELLTALGSRRAVAGGTALASYIDSLPRHPGTRVTVIGHSYGSLVIAEGLRRGMRVDGVVVAGSPGLGVDSARALPLHGVPLFALRAPFDAPALSEAFGRDPADPRFGATRLDTGDGDDQPTGHSAYFDPGTLALQNIAAVVVGRDDRLVVETASATETVQGIVDDYWRGRVDPPVDAAQEAIDMANALLHTLDDVPGPLGVAAAATGSVRDAVLEEAQRLVDTLQRAASPDFLGDLLADAWDVFG